ncbi:efflux RND transporter periplasmic adaptor subunit [uncultured Oxalicibacterium sp.]|uniref:efflux RND transporter periplasmic adaptor subunit n=1 Tax=uncultured Oxalicibacterium sp. TaxID=1168540 RepID=UPI0025E39DBA|nr:efflux RND transporter periplasmic adaptor subunit [uncultured Oxalicibacterium sp.]
MKSSSKIAGLRQRFVNRYTVAGLVAVLLIGGGYWGWQKVNARKNAANQYQVAEIERGDLEDLVTATGTVQPLEYVDVGAQVSGQLKKLHVEVGSIVKEGDLLAEIDPTVLRATVDARRAGLRNLIASKKNQQAQFELAQIQAQRQRNLFAEDATTKDALQTAETTLKSAQAQVEALQAQIEQTESTLRADEANLNYAKIFAPMSGTVVSVTARQGQTLNANQSAPTILRVADLSTMTVQTQVSEAEVGKLRKDMDVYFTTLGSQGRRWYGKLRKLEPTPTVTNNVVLYNALFDVPNRNQALLPNMTTQVFFVAATAKDALLVPTAAVTLTRGAGGGSRGNAGQGSSKNPFAGITAEQRSAAIEKMSPEERAAMRERRRTQENAKENEKTADAPADKPATQQAATQNKDAAATDSDTNSISTGDSSGLPAQNEQRGKKTGTVRVINADNNIEQRTIELGVTTRVQMQVLSGLKEGERVITGMKQANAGNRPSGVAGLPPGMGGSPMRGR